MPQCKHCSTVFEGVYRERFCSLKCQLMFRVNVSSSGCLEWGGAIAKSGYGAMNIGTRIETTHRVAYSVFIGEIPDGLFVCHKCDNRKCVNPEHLFIGTHKDNMRDMNNKGRNAWTGKTFSEEYRRKLSDAHLNSSYVMTDSHRELLKVRLRERWGNAEFKKKMAAIYATPEFRASCKNHN